MSSGVKLCKLHAAIRDASISSMMSPLACWDFTAATTFHLSTLPKHSRKSQTSEGHVISGNFLKGSLIKFGDEIMSDLPLPPLHPAESIEAGIYKSDRIDALPNPGFPLLALHRNAVLNAANVTHTKS